MIYMCIICTVKKPSLLSLSDEHRQILEAIVSPTINLAQFKSSPLWICDSCQGLVNIVEAFKNKALAGASHLVSALTLVQEEQNKPEDSLLLAVKEEPDDLLEAKPFIEFEIEIEEGKWKDQELKVNVKKECVESDDNHSESSHPLTNPQGHPCQDSLPSKLAAKIKPAVSEPVRLPTLVLCPLTVRGDSSADRQTDNVQVQVSDLFLCRICGQRIPTPQIDAHTALHTAPYSCYGCCYETGDKGDIVQHCCDGVVLEKSGVKSQKKDSGSKAKSSANRVSRAKGPKPRKEYRCSECYLRFVDEAGLARHTQKYQSETHVCELCRKEFKSKCRLNIHLAVHRRQESQSVDTIKPELFCAECGIQFPTKQRFQLHMNSLKHTPRDKWKFKCDECGKLYVNKYELKVHVNIVHLEKSKHECSQCHKVFRSGYLLRKHVATVHEGKAKPRPHVCHECGAAFTERQILTEHLTRHSNVRPHACPLCPATFKFKAALFTHNRLKHLKVKGNCKKPEKGKKKKEVKVETKSLEDTAEMQIGS